MPKVFKEESIGGASAVAIPPGNFTTAELSLGTEAADRTRVEVNGGRPLVREVSTRGGHLIKSVAEAGGRPDFK